MRYVRSIMSPLAALCIGSAATAADFPVTPVRPIPIVTAPIFSWTGIYIGGNVGYGWGDTTGALALPVPGNFGVSGALAGGQVGWNYQFVGTPFVIGIEADYQWANLEGDAAVFPVVTANAELKQFGTIRGRAGFAWNRFMIYGTGGWAFGARTEATFGPAPILTDSRDLSGWTAGAGVEWAFTPNWSAKLEYLHLDLGSSAFFPLICAPPICDAGLTIDLVRVGVNYRFPLGRY